MPPKHNRSVIWMASVYLFSPLRRSFHLLMGLGFSAGIFVLLTVWGVMNVLQKDIIDSLIEEQSFHIQLHTSLDERSTIKKWLHEQEAVVSVTPFFDALVLPLSNNSFSSQGHVLRILPLELFYQHFPLFNTHYSTQKRLLLLSADAANGVFSSSLSVVYLSSKPTVSLSPLPFGIMGYVSMQNREGLPFLGYAPNTLLENWNLESEFRLGVMMRDIDAVDGLVNQLRRRFPSILSLLSWKTVNYSILSALRVEKIVLSFFIAILFIVVGISTVHLFSSSLSDRQGDIAILRVFGIPLQRIMSVFLWEAGLISLMSIAGGTIAGLFSVFNIHHILYFGRQAISLLHSVLFTLSQVLGFSYRPPHSTFDAIFIDQAGIISWKEALFVAFFALLVSFGSCILAFRRMRPVYPQELLRL